MITLPFEIIFTFFAFLSHLPKLNQSTPVSRSAVTAGCLISANPEQLYKSSVINSRSLPGL